jgi:molybdopterin/thiamine biosynthesis adenylyltransferase
MSISETEAKLYDRQIRLWGIDAQQRMSKTRLLVYGMKGISSETCKNLGFCCFFKFLSFVWCWCGDHYG